MQILCTLRLTQNGRNSKKKSKLKKKIIKKPCFLTIFQRLFNFGSILVHQTSKFNFSGCWIFLVVSAIWHFFHSSQIEARCHLYWFDMIKSDNIAFYSHNGWIYKVIQAVSVVIWKESELISPVCSSYSYFVEI